MATVFMKWLETTPGAYDRGIQLLTLNKLQPLKVRIASEMVKVDDRVLEIGCGTGTLAVLMARRGATVTGVDAAPLMLAEAQRKVAAEGLDERVTLMQMDASTLTDNFSANSFDVIVSTLVFSELTEDERCFVLDECRTLLAPGGRLIIADEVVPAGTLARLLYYLLRLPLVLITWLLTRTTTHPLRRLPQELAEAGFQTRPALAYLGSSLALYEAAPVAKAQPEALVEEKEGMATCCVPCAVQSVVERDSSSSGFASGVVGRLRHRVTWRTRLTDVWCLFFRMLPPYPKVRPGLYRVGEPDRAAPVLVTGNYDLTVRRVVKAIDDRVDAWLLVADSAGINVWCAAGGGHFTADKVIAAVKTSGVADTVDHHALILPQLAANGVDGWKIRQETGWGVHWGPARAQDIPAYLQGRRAKTDAMRWVTFPLRDRLEMTASAWGFYALLLAVGLGLFWRTVFWPAMIATAGLGLFYGVFLPWLPGRDGLYKGVTLAALAVAGTLAFSVAFAPAPALTLINRCLGLGFLAFFIGGEFQGMSPLMRGEDGNWGIEAVVGLVVLAAYLVLPRILGL